MKKNYEKPVLNSSMTGTLEGVYAAYGLSCTTGSANPGNDDNGGNGGNEEAEHRGGCVYYGKDWFGYDLYYNPNGIFTKIPHHHWW